MSPNLTSLPSYSKATVARQHRMTPPPSITVSLMVIFFLFDYWVGLFISRPQILHAQKRAVTFGRFRILFPLDNCLIRPTSTRIHLCFPAFLVRSQFRLEGVVFIFRTVQVESFRNSRTHTHGLFSHEPAPLMESQSSAYCL